MACNQNCREFCSWIETLPCHVRYNIPKEAVPQLPECFQRTILGEMVRGSGRQFRGPHGAHVHEFQDRWMLHRDQVDAKEDPLGHLVQDAPEYLASLILGAFASVALSRRSKRQALVVAGLASTFALVSGKMIKLLQGDPGDGQGEGPARTPMER
jgi:hypothetical protein